MGLGPPGSGGRNRIHFAWETVLWMVFVLNTQVVSEETVAYTLLLVVGCVCVQHFTLCWCPYIQHLTLCWCPYIQHFAEKTVSDHRLTIDGGHYSHLRHAQTHSDVLSGRGGKFSRENILPQGVRLQAQNYVKTLNRGFVGQKTPWIPS